MERHELTHASRDALSRLLACERDPAPPWNATDLHAILRHQLETDIEFDLTHFGGDVKETLVSVTASQVEKGCRTFEQALTTADTPLELLDLIRRFAKRLRANESEELPDEVATVLYFAAIAAARLHHGASLSKLDDQTLQEGLSWGLEQSWLTESLRNLFSKTVEVIRSQTSEPDA